MGCIPSAITGFEKQMARFFVGVIKVILIEEDRYQLQLSRYIHRNPIEAGIVDRLESYPWSSYPHYVSKSPAPKWLDRGEIYGQLSAKSRQGERYRAYVEMGVDDEIATFYGKGNQMPYLGSDAFRDWAYRQRQTDEGELNRKTIQSFRPTIGQVTGSVARHFKVDADTITKSQRGRVDENIARWVAMYLAQETCGLTLGEIADYMGLKRTGSIPTTISKLKARVAKNARLAKVVEDIKSEYCT